MKLFFYILPFLTLAQTDIVWNDLTNHLSNGKGGWGIGNACGEDYFSHGVYKGDLDMKGDPLQILNSHFVVEGNIINQGEIIYLCDNAILEVKGGVLSVENPTIEDFKIYPNPAINEINIKGIEVKELEIYDMTGRRIKHYQTFGMLHKIMIDDLQSGIYFLKINNSITHKIIKI